MERRAVYIVDGKRTPFIKAANPPGEFSGVDLAHSACRQLLLEQPFAAKDLDEVVAGCVIPGADEANAARILSLRLGCGKEVPAYTVQRNCASGMQALDSAMKDIQLGRCDLVLAGGTEAMSRAPLMYGPEMVRWFSQMMQARTLKSRLLMLTKFKLKNLKPIVALLLGLSDQTIGMNMGQTAEELAYKFSISRQEMDAFALQSHQRVLQAQEQGFFEEISPLVSNKGKVYDNDNGARSDSRLERLARLKPMFDKKVGSVTPGNSSQITDGAAFMLLASKEAVEKYGLKVRAKIVDVAWSGVAPELMGLGPAHAIADILKAQQASINDVDYWEINEAFAVQVLACVKALASDAYCQENLASDKAIGDIPQEKLNVFGGAIAQGHPVGASGARIVLQLINVLERNDAQRGIASLCIGGGQGGALMIERTVGVK